MHGPARHAHCMQEWALLKKWACPGLFLFIFAFSILFNWQINFCQCWDSNCGSLVSEVTAQPTVPQPLSRMSSLYFPQLARLKQQNNAADFLPSSKVRHVSFYPRLSLLKPVSAPGKAIFSFIFRALAPNNFKIAVSCSLKAAKMLFKICKPQS